MSEGKWTKSPKKRKLLIMPIKNYQFTRAKTEMSTPSFC